MINKSENTKIIRWGIIGCGNVTEVKSGPAYQKTAGFTIQAVMRRDAEKAADYAKRHGIPSYYTHADDLIMTQILMPFILQHRQTHTNIMG
jgi:1,5-anhydro-D-fructose reductase (1,5-anhydro-D-mannitol-forming)